MIAEKTDESMSDEEKLHALYEYVSGSFGYLRRNYYEPGEHDWLNEEAKTMLTERNGNCYNFAATFCLLARCIGYDAEAYSGTIYGRAEPGQTRPPDRPHGWVEIEIDGQTYIFDPDMQAVVAYWYQDDSFYMQDDGIRNQYGYTKAESDQKPEPTPEPTKAPARAELHAGPEQYPGHTCTGYACAFYTRTFYARPGYSCTGHACAGHACAHRPASSRSRPRGGRGGSRDCRMIGAEVTKKP